MVFAARTRMDPTPMRPDETAFQFLDRVAGEPWRLVRELIAEWAAHLDESARDDVIGRLRSADRRHFDAAFWELYCHETLLRLGFSVTCHPAGVSERGNPDFLAEGSESFILEATAAAPSDAQEAADRREDQVYDALNRLDSPDFFLAVDIAEAGDYAPPVKSLGGQLEDWLRGLDPDVIAKIAEEDGTLLLSDRVPVFPWTDGRGWQLSFRPIPKKPASRGKPGLRPVGMQSPKAAFTDDVGRLRKAIRDKASSYGRLAHPYVIAVRGEFGTDTHDALSALYGSEQVTFRALADGSTETEPSRADNGLFWGCRGARNRRVSPFSSPRPWHRGPLPSGCRRCGSTRARRQASS